MFKTWSACVGKQVSPGGGDVLPNPAIAAPALGTAGSTGGCPGGHLDFWYGPLVKPDLAKCTFLQLLAVPLRRAMRFVVSRASCALG